MKDEHRGVEGIAKILVAHADGGYCGEDISPNERFHPGCGCTVTKLTRSDIDNLLAGEPLWFDDGEYSHILVMEKCPDCNGTGIIETGNNDLPCNCPAGDTAMFNDAFLGLVSGATIKGKNR